MRKLLPPGRRLGRYEIQSSLGSGAMADVYLARDLLRGREVALKVLASGLETSTQLLRRFDREARAALSSHHRNIVAVHEVGFEGGTPFIAMEYVPGRTLRAVMDEGPLALSKIRDIGAQLAEGLAAAHGAGIVHRDLKPENVMLTEEGVVKILDFGLSKPLAKSKYAVSEAAETDEALTLPGTILGTLQYMSPEQASGYAVDYRADQFSLGAILYEMVTGRVAFQRDTVPRTLAAVIEGRPSELERFDASAPAEVRPIVERLLQKSPAARYSEMRTVAEALRNLPADSRLTGALCPGAIVGAVVAFARLLA